MCCGEIFNYKVFLYGWNVLFTAIDYILLYTDLTFNSQGYINDFILQGALETLVYDPTVLCVALQVFCSKFECVLRVNKEKGGEGFF